MKRVGEVMCIARRLEAGIQKAIRAIDDRFVGFAPTGPTDDIDPTDKLIFPIAGGFQRGCSVKNIWEMDQY